MDNLTESDSVSKQAEIINQIGEPKPRPTLVSNQTEAVFQVMRHATELMQAGELNQSQRLYEKILDDDPDHFNALRCLALNLSLQGAYDRAESLFERAVMIDASLASVFNHRAVNIRYLGKIIEALSYLDRAVSLDPNYVEAHYNRANTLKELGLFEEARKAYAEALRLNPNYVEALNNCGVLFQSQNQHRDAITFFLRALANRPDHVLAHNNVGVSLEVLGEFNQAVKSWQTAILLDSACCDARINVAMMSLRNGDYLDGWREYEWRLEMGDLKSKLSSISLPRWCGESNIDGKRILITAEQGLGDFIHFSRYIPMLFDKGAQVVLETPEALKSLASSLHPDLEIVESGCDYPDAEVFCPIMSLPHAFSTTVDTIPGAPYLFANTEKGEQWRTRLGRGAAKKIGLVWSGNKAHKNDHNRSTDLRTLEPLFSLPFEWHSLQKELRSGDAEFLEQYPSVQQHQDQLSSFDDTAALIDALDLVITVDTSVAHLAGALGKPVWIMLPKVPDYRWMLDRNDTPWYPSARLFRQTTSGDWSDVVSLMHREFLIYG